MIETDPRDHVIVSRTPRFTSTTSFLRVLERRADPMGSALLHGPSVVIHLQLMKIDV